MNHSDERAWRRLTESAAGVDLEGTLLDVLAEGMPKRSTELAVRHTYHCSHGGGAVAWEVEEDDVLPLAQRETPVEEEPEDAAVAPGLCQHLADLTFLDSYDAVIDAEGDDWMRLSVLVDKATIEGCLALWDHMDIPHECEPGGDFFWTLIEKVLETWINGMGR